MKQPYLQSAWFDNLWITLPGFICTCIVLLFLPAFNHGHEISDMQWVLLVLMVDVSHVYASLYRTYFDRSASKQFHSKFIFIPLFCFLLAFLTWQIGGPVVFWRTLAYIAVYHFIRQQYGFLKLYNRQQIASKLQNHIDAIMIYSATIYPILYWHFHPHRNFNWFTPHDFFTISSSIPFKLVSWLYVAIILVYTNKEIYVWVKHKTFNIPKNLLILSTACSWYLGIVGLNSDLAFTFLNTITHGIPYMALVWIYARRKNQSNPAVYAHWIKTTLKNYAFPLFFLVLFLCGYLEEGLWDGLVWQEHPHIFPTFSFMHSLADKTITGLLIPLLIVPQLTHYVIDGFIWKVNKDQKLNTLINSKE